MGAVTSRGLPYPVGTDRVMDGDNAIQALAEAVGKMVVIGSGSTANLATTTVANSNVNFPTPFKAGSVPVVMLTISTTAPHVLELSLVSVTEAGFTVAAYRTTGTGPFNFNYMAVGVVP